MPEANEITNTANIPETLQCDEVSVAVDATEVLDSPGTAEIMMAPEVSGRHRTPSTPSTPQNQETLSHVITATEWLPSQGVRTPQRSSQISTSSSRLSAAESHSTDEEGINVDLARKESLVPAQSEGVVEQGAAAAEPIMPTTASPPPTVYTRVPTADDRVVAMNIDESDTHSTNGEGINANLARKEPLVQAQSEGAVEKGAAAAEPIMPAPASPPPTVDTRVPQGDNCVFPMNIDESNILTIPPSGKPQASESTEISPSAVEKGMAKEGENVATLTAHGTPETTTILPSKPVRLDLQMSQFQGLFKMFQ